jgi:glycosyltransferase involved in cell wall biosynthesis
LIAKLADRVDFLALVDPSWGPLDLDVPTMPLRTRPRAPALVWLNTQAPRALRDYPGVFHTPFNFVPLLCPRPSIASIPDISYVTHAHLFSKAKARAFRFHARWAIKHSRIVTTVSEWSRSQILSTYALDPNRVEIVANGVGPEFRPLTEDDRAAWENMLIRLDVRPPYLVAFGGAARRGIEIAISAWSILRREGFEQQLVVIGEDGPSESGLTRVNRPSQAELRLILAGGDLLLYPTETESFGMPGLEAAASGTPPVCPRVGALPEVLGNSAAWCDRNDRSLAHAAADVLTDSARSEELRREGIQRATLWSWEGAAEQLLSVYNRVLDGA